jgi:hypothetical protein
VVRIIPAQLICSKRWLHSAQLNRQISQEKVLFVHCPVFPGRICPSVPVQLREWSIFFEEGGN